MSPSRRSVVDDDGNDNDIDNDIDNDNDDGTKKCTRCIRGPSYKHGHDITCPRSQKYVASCNNNNNNNNSISNISNNSNNSSTVNNTNNNNDQTKQTAVGTKNLITETINNNTKSPESESDPELEGINGRAEAIFTKGAINTTKSPTELEPELEEQQQRKRKKVMTTNTTTKIRTETTTTRRVDDGTKECTRCVRGPKYKHGHDITCQRSQNYVSEI